MKFSIYITAEEGTLLDTITIDTSVKNWDAPDIIRTIGNEIFDKIKRAEGLL